MNEQSWINIELITRNAKKWYLCCYRPEGSHYLVLWIALRHAIALCMYAYAVVGLRESLLGPVTGFRTCSCIVYVWLCHYRLGESHCVVKWVPLHSVRYVCVFFLYHCYGYATNRICKQVKIVTKMIVAGGQGVLIIYIKGSDHVCNLKVEPWGLWQDNLVVPWNCSALLLFVIKSIWIDKLRYLKNIWLNISTTSTPVRWMDYLDKGEMLIDLSGICATWPKARENAERQIQINYYKNLTFMKSHM